jgi:hypothetical protein
MKSPHPTRLTTLEANKRNDRLASRFCLFLAALATGLAMHGVIEHDAVSASIGAGAAVLAGGLALFKQMESTVYQAELLAYGRPGQPGQPRQSAQQ